MKKILNKAPIVGIVRYSQKITFQGGDKDVFESNYFEYRYKIFTEVTLKSFQKQTDPNFILLILHSATMPIDLKNKFLELESKNQFLYNVFVEDNAESFQDALQNSKGFMNFDNSTGLSFRIDNDDAVPTHFIENLTLFLDPSFVGSCINLPNILIVKRAQIDQYLVERRYFPSNSMGLAYVTSENDFRTVLDINQHHLVNENNNLILLPKHSGMPLQTINGENAINSINDSASITFTGKKLQKFLNDNNYGEINLKCLKILGMQKRNYVKDIVNLVTPPVFKILARKIYTLTPLRK